MKFPADKLLLLPAAGLAVFLAAAGAAYITDTEKSRPEPRRTQALPAASPLPEKEKQQAPRPARIKTSLLLQPLRNPFLPPAELAAPPAAGQKTVPAAAPILRGTVAAGSRLLAIIEYGGSSSVCRAGDSIGGCTVREISAGSVLLSSPAGHIRLALAEGAGI